MLVILTLFLITPINYSLGPLPALFWGIPRVTKDTTNVLIPMVKSLFLRMLSLINTLFPLPLKLRLLYCPLHLPTASTSFIPSVQSPTGSSSQPAPSSVLPLLNPPIPCKPIPNLVVSSLVILLPYFLLLQSSKLSPLLFGDKQCNLNMMP